MFFALKIVNPIKKVDSAVNEIASGNADLTQRINVDSNDEIGSLEKGFNKFIEKLQNIISQIQGSKTELTAVMFLSIFLWIRLFSFLLIPFLERSA